MKYKILGIFALIVFAMPMIAFAQENADEVLNETDFEEEVLPAAGITPDSAFYGIKRAVERVQMAFTRDEVARANLRMRFAEIRLSEAREMAEEGKPEHIENLLINYNNEMNQTRERMEQRYAECVEREDETCERYADVIEKVSEATTKHVLVLEGVQERVPEEAREAIERAINKSIRGHEQTQERMDEIFINIAEKREEARDRIGRPEINDFEEERRLIEEEEEERRLDMEEEKTPDTPERP